MFLTFFPLFYCFSTFLSLISLFLKLLNISHSTLVNEEILLLLSKAADSTFRPERKGKSHAHGTQDIISLRQTLRELFSSSTASPKLPSTRPKPMAILERKGIRFQSSLGLGQITSSAANTSHPRQSSPVYLVNNEKTPPTPTESQSDAQLFRIAVMSDGFSLGFLQCLPEQGPQKYTLGLAESSHAAGILFQIDKEENMPEKCIALRSIAANEYISSQPSHGQELGPCNYIDVTTGKWRIHLNDTESQYFSLNAQTDRVEVSNREPLQFSLQRTAPVGLELLKDFGMAVTKGKKKWGM
jgi:hypothetical protein